MEWVATLLWPLLGLTFLLFLQIPGTQATGRRLLHPDPLPLCSQVRGGIPGWDCYDPSNHPLPPCDFHHQRIGFDCSGWPPVSRAGAASPTTFKSKTRPLLERHIAIELPPCSQSSGDTNSWKCYDAFKRHLPPCDIINRRSGVDCSGWEPKWPPAVGSDVGEASLVTVKSEMTQEKDGHVEGELPPCRQVPGGIPGWDCYDPPNHPLPPCDFYHQRIGFDCSGWPPVSHAGAASPTTFKSKERQMGIDLPPCSQSSGDTNSWKCYDASKRHLPPCDIINRRIGVNCSGWPPKWPPAVGSDVGEASPATVESETTQEKGGP